MSVPLASQLVCGGLEMPLKLLKICRFIRCEAAVFGNLAKFCSCPSGLLDIPVLLPRSGAEESSFRDRGPRNGMPTAKS